MFGVNIQLRNQERADKISQADAHIETPSLVVDLEEISRPAKQKRCSESVSIYHLFSILS